VDDKREVYMVIRLYAIIFQVVHVLGLQLSWHEFNPGETQNTVLPNWDKV